VNRKIISQGGNHLMEMLKIMGLLLSPTLVL